MAAVWFVWIKPVEMWRCFLGHPQPSAGPESPTLRRLEMQGDYTGTVDFGIPTDSFRRQIPHSLNFLTLQLICEWEPPGARVLD